MTFLMTQNKTNMTQTEYTTLDVQEHMSNLIIYEKRQQRGNSHLFPTNVIQFFVQNSDCKFPNICNTDTIPVCNKYVNKQG